MRRSVFLFFAALYVATTAGHIYTIDGYLNYAVTKAIGERGSLEVPRFMMTVEGKDGRHYSKLGVGQSLVSLPLFWIGSAVEKASPGSRVYRAYSSSVNVPAGTGTIVAEPQELVKTSDIEGARVFFTVLTNALVAALCCLIFWSILRRFGLSRKGALWAACLLGFATPMWVYARDFFAEPLFTACLLGSLYLVTDGASSRSPRRLVLAGLVTGLGILTRVSFIPIAVIVAAYITLSSGDVKRGGRQAAWYAAACVPGLAVVAALNLWRFGGVLLTGYHTAYDKGFSIPLAKGVLWNLASPYRGILLFAPAVVVFGLGVRDFARRHRSEAWLTISIIAYVFVLYSKWWAWHGGWCWGPRFLLPAVPLLLLPGIVRARTKKWLVVTAAILGLVGFGVQISGVLINYTAAYDYWIKIKRLDWAEANIQSFSPIGVHLKALSATGPRQYDLWLVQAARVIGWQVIWVVLVLAGVAYVSASRIVRPARKG